MFLQKRFFKTGEQLGTIIVILLSTYGIMVLGGSTSEFPQDQVKELGSNLQH